MTVKLKNQPYCSNSRSVDFTLMSKSNRYDEKGDCSKFASSLIEMPHFYSKAALHVSYMENAIPECTVTSSVKKSIQAGKVRN